MEIKEILRNYKEASEALGNESATSLISDFIEKTEKQRYELPLIGQFSAGKSATLNHLLGRRLLPTKSIETTAFATFVSYSETEGAILEMADGTQKEIALEEIAELDNQKVEETGKEIKSLHIGLNCEMLRGGLTFADTPGVNTIITTHIEITERILRDAQYIIYVMAKGLTDEDLLMIQTIEGKNIPVIFVRTHLDDLKSSEENWRETIVEEKKRIEEQVGHEIKYFAISNDESRKEFEQNFAELKKYLGEEIAADVKRVYEKAICERLNPIREELERTISIKRQTIEKAANESKEEIERQRKHTEDTLDLWREKLQQQQSKIEKKADEVKEEIETEVRKSAKRRTQKFESEAKETENASAEEMNRMVQTALNEATTEMNGEAEKILQAGADSICTKIGEEMQSVGNALSNIGIDTDCTFDLSIARDYAERIRATDEEYETRTAQIEAMKQEIARNSELSAREISQLESAIAEADKALKETQANVKEITNSYTPRYVTKQSGLGGTLRKVGNALDAAMLLIPAARWAKVSKWASGLGKTGSVMGTVGKGIADIAKVAEKTDAAKDAATLLGGIKNASAFANGEQPKEKKTSIFDYLSLSHWLGKLGETIDPPTQELDEEYEREYNSALNAAREKAKEASSQKMKMIENLGKLNGKEWEMKQKQDAAAKAEAELEKETRSIRERLDAEREKAVRESLTEQAATQFAEKINDYADALIRKATATVESTFGSIVEAADLKVSTQLNFLSEQLAELGKKKESSEANLETEIATLTQLSEKLRK